MKHPFLLLAVSVAMSALAGSPANPDALDLMPIPQPVEWQCDMDRPVAFDRTAVVRVACPDPAARDWLARHFAEWFGDEAPQVAAADAALDRPAGEESYALSADASGIRISAQTLAGVRWAAYTLRPLAIARRGTMTVSGRILPTLAVRDTPRFGFRAVHICWFPETRPQQIERALRLAALMKFNYAIIESWGVYASARHPWWRGPVAPMTPAEVRRLAALGKDLGITLIPQLNAFGHAAMARACSMKHVILDLRPAYEPLYEPGGWNWCLTNPETQRVLRELIAEMYEDFGRPPYFHLGCDEAQPPSCPDCRKVPYGALVAQHIADLSDYVKGLGARTMIWHDMLLEKSDPRWKGFVRSGSQETARLADLLPKDVIVCDWQYGRRPEGCTGWPTMGYLREKGFDVVGCPWMNFDEMESMGGYLAQKGGFGFIETTWHHLRGDDWVKMYRHGAAAAWGTPVVPGTPAFDTRFGLPMRLVGHDMKVTDPADTGDLNTQVPPTWWVENN